MRISCRLGRLGAAVAAAALALLVTASLAAVQTDGFVVFRGSAANPWYRMAPDGTGGATSIGPADGGNWWVTDVSRGQTPATVLLQSTGTAPLTIYAMPATGGTPVALLGAGDPSPAQAATFLSDGVHIGYIVNDADNISTLHVGTIARDTAGNVVAVTDSSPVYEAPAGQLMTSVTFAPDGLRAVVGLRAASNDWHLWLLTAGGAGWTAERLTSASVIMDRWPRWSPVADLVVFERDEYIRNSQQNNVWIYDLATRTERQLTTKSNWGNANGGYREHPAWSKNGAYVMFSGKNSKNGYDLYQIRTDGAEKAIQVTSTSGSELYPAWGW